jgi:DNA polymerase-3 subunit alpha
LGETYGIIVYQEQILRIVQVIAGYSLANADLLRRAIGKKIESEMQRHRGIFVEQATKLHGDKNKAEELFDLIEKFAQYGFVKAHATCYAMVMYRMAYLKAHYTIYFICVGFTTDHQHQDRLIQWKREADREGITVLPPCIAHSSGRFSIEDGCIRYGLSALKNVGEGMAEVICKAREAAPFSSPWDFAKRTAVNKQALESLIKSGALDTFGVSRNILMHNLPHLLHQPLLFEPEFERSPEWSDELRYKYAFETVGMYLGEHPLSGLPLNALGFSKCIDGGVGDGVTVIGSVLHVDRRRMKNGSIYGILALSDQHGIVEISVFSELWSRVQKTVKPGQVVWCKVRTGRRGIAAQYLGLAADGLDIRSIRCVVDRSRLEALKLLPHGQTKLIVEHDGVRWDVGNIKLDLGTIRRLSSTPGLRWCTW